MFVFSMLMFLKRQEILGTYRVKKKRAIKVHQFSIVIFRFQLLDLKLL